MTKRNGAAQRQKVERTSAGLRDALFDELDDLRSGVTNPTKANATAKLAGTIIDSVQMELDVQRILNRLPKERSQVSLPGISVRLGSD